MTNSTPFNASFRFSRGIHFNLKVNLSLNSGITGIAGPSGVGKTTLLRVIAGLESPDDGLIRLRENTFVDTSQSFYKQPQDRKTAVVFQESLLFPHKSVLKNLRFGSPKKTLKSTSYQIMEHDVVLGLEINDILTRSPSTLSGGQKQRVAVGRAILSQPHLLLLDEPWSALDNDSARKMNSMIQYFSTVNDIPVIIISHDIEMLYEMCNHVLYSSKDSEGSTCIQNVNPESCTSATIFKPTI
jgi:molybdate transport system ATP-binding protein